MARSVSTKEDTGSFYASLLLEDDVIVSKVTKKNYCDICKIYFQDDNEHLKSINHLTNVLKTEPEKLSPLLLTCRESKGYEILRKMGYNERTDYGLGPKLDGKRFPIATTLKRDRRGLGFGGKNNATRITHFKPFDDRAVKNERMRKFSSQTLPKKYHIARLKAEKVKEDAIRKELNSKVLSE